MAQILVAEDEIYMRNIIVEYLEAGGHTCLVANNGMDALMLLKNNSVNLAVLDIMMPMLDGFEVCKLARENIIEIPILFLTVKDDETDKLKGYELGADDYMTKPFSPKLLLAKVNALLRRIDVSNVQQTIQVGEIALNPVSRMVTVEGETISLTFKEFELLQFMMMNPNKVFSREQLLNRIWGYDFEGSTRTVDSHIKTLRKKLGEEASYIVTLIRSGYKFEVRS
ncbi:response regulator transcription factor [Amphibacillus sp. Q70]|uniref:response regulator transcription factor n=1 Tax=Amphibacillus sp. Q70 TaxID=3453416 RepID=UPI003F834D06